MATDFKDDSLTEAGVEEGILFLYNLEFCLSFLKKCK